MLDEVVLLEEPTFNNCSLELSPATGVPLRLCRLVALLLVDTVEVTTTGGGGGGGGGKPWFTLNALLSLPAASLIDDVIDCLLVATAAAANRLPPW